MSAGVGRRFAGGVAVALAVFAAGCGAIPQQSQDRANCVPLFIEYDRIARFTRDEYVDRRPGFTVLDPRLSQLSVLLIQNDCQTRGRDLARLGPVADARGGAPIIEGGAPLGRPVSVHVGVVTSDAEAARAAALFREVGLQATSIGSPRLGRRVYAGPVETTDGLNAVLGLAREAGFVAPYASEFFRF